MGKFIDLTGQKFERLTVIKRAKNTGEKTTFLCKCECGTLKKIVGNSLKNRLTKSCGCLNREVLKIRRFVHGLTFHPLYRKLRNMIDRCENPKCERYHYYGGRGISICKEWRENPKAFIDWGLKSGWERGLTIDRINNDGNYEPKNCQWLTRSENVKKANRDRKVKRGSQ